MVRNLHSSCGPLPELTFELRAMPAREESLRLDVERFLHEKIPLTLAMRVRVTNIEPMTLEAPVEFNSNHLKTGFGGSINAIATLAGYGFLWLELRPYRFVHIVIAESSIRFLRPVHRVIRAICQGAAAEELDRFKDAVATGDRARINLRVQIEESRTIAAEFAGQFVVKSDT